MKKYGRKLAVILAVMMIFTSFELVGVFAEDTPEGEAPVVTEEALAPAEDGNVSQEAAKADGEDLGGDQGDQGDQEEPEVDPAKLKIEGLSLLSGYNCVVLRWKKIDIEGFDVEYYVAGKDVTKDVKPYNYVPGRITGGGDYVMYQIPIAASANTSLPQYRYEVYAKAGGKEGPKSVSNYRAPVRTIAYKFTVKTGTTLKKHGGNGPRTYKLKKGQTVIAYGFGGGGCYMFKHEGSIFYCAKIRAKKPKAIYTTSFNYTPEEAELYLSQKGASSKTNVFIWCNSYTQHLYYMQRSNGRWVVADHWECSTGKASAPTPTGMYGIKKIEGKWKKHHNIKWWSKFSGTNSVHGQKKGWTFGKPKSNGCIRNPVAKAKIVYYGAAVGTGVLIF